VRLFELVIVFSVAVTYASFGYPEISGVFGGGRRDPVMLFVAPRGSEIAKALKLPVDADGKAIGPIEILAESQTMLAVLPVQQRSGQAVQIARGVVEGIGAVSDGR